MALYAAWHLEVVLQLLFPGFTSSVLSFHSVWDGNVILSNGNCILEVNNRNWKDPGCRFHCFFRLWKHYSIQDTKGSDNSASFPPTLVFKWGRL